MEGRHQRGAHIAEADNRNVCFMTRQRFDGGQFQFPVLALAISRTPLESPRCDGAATRVLLVSVRDCNRRFQAGQAGGRRKTKRRKQAAGWRIAGTAGRRP